MDLQDFLNRCDARRALTGMSEARLSTILFGSGATLKRLRAGAGITIRVLARADERLVALGGSTNVVADGQKAA